MTYLDYAASTPIDPRVLDVMTAVYLNHPGNASSRTHTFGDDCRDIVETSRKVISAFLGVASDELIYTSGATEADNLAIMGLLDYGIKIGKRHIVSTAIEHKAVLNSLGKARSLGFEIDLIKPSANGSINVDDVMNAVRDDTLLVSIMHVNNETGAVQPVEAIGLRLSEMDESPYFHIDAAQSAGKLVEEIKNTEYDLLSLSAHKMYGPQGIGALVVKKRKLRHPPLNAILFGGNQENGLRPGTLPVALIAGFSQAVKLCKAEWQKDSNDSKLLRDLIEGLLKDSGIKYTINGACMTYPGILNVRFPGVSSEALMIAGKSSFAISNGSACSSQSYSPSYVLKAMGLSDVEALESVRISWGRGSIQSDVLSAVSKMISIVKSFQ